MATGLRQGGDDNDGGGSGLPATTVSDPPPPGLGRIYPSLATAGTTAPATTRSDGGQERKWRVGAGAGAHNDEGGNNDYGDKLEDGGSVAFGPGRGNDDDGR
uniref:DUF834 domain-containing protein n=1 Tax=Oryza punctata TaxID=4537 RepID=A0A0E0JJK8_ORYPU